MAFVQYLPYQYLSKHQNPIFRPPPFSSEFADTAHKSVNNFPDTHFKKKQPINYYPDNNISIEYHADLRSGLIGITNAEPVDNPYDNIFHFQIPEPVAPGHTAYLKYSLFGISDHSGVARSINNEQAVGGEFIKLHTGWTEQKEIISVSALTKGDNIIRFCLPANANYYYRIKNVTIVIEKDEHSLPEIIINSSSYQKGCNEFYISGIIKTNSSINEDISKIQLFYGNTQVPVYNGEFEFKTTADTTKSNNQEAVLKAILPGGKIIEKPHTVTENVISDFTHIATSKGLTVTGKYDLQKGLELFGSKEVNAGIKIPEMALSEQKAISIISLREVDVPALGTEIVNVTKGASAYRFLPHGTIFNKPAKILIPFDSTLIPEGYTVKDIRTYFFDEMKREWIDLPLDTLLAKDGLVISASNHFTDMINGIIKVPESPQTQGYTPTSIKDLKAGNPSLGIEMMEPPVVNNVGNAVTKLELKLPGGRQGMEPNLDLQYNSDAGNSWLGLGWNITIPFIGIDTRFGVPRYDPSFETETYSLSSEQLAPFTDKGALQPRSSTDKQFFPRVEGRFTKIIRHGILPSNYWWEVTDKTGTRSFYGGSPSSGLVDNAVLKDNAGNIAQWGLVETRDLNENFVNYTYQTVNDIGLAAGSIPGRQLYISQIRYAGNGTTPGPYSIEFIRDRQLGEPKRKDIDINARLGFKMVTADLLRKVVISFNGQPIRSYELQFIEGAFYKTLLKSFKEIDAGGIVFNTHTLEYFDDVKSGTGYTPYGNAENWSPANDDIKGDISNPNPGFTGEASAIGATKSSSNSYSMARTQGPWNGLRDKSNTVGGITGGGSSNSEGLVALIDINGDGLPDKVFKKNGQLQYRANLGSPSQPFGAAKIIAGVNTFSSGSSTTVSNGNESNNSPGAYIGRIYSTTTNTTTEYLSDFNGDGLIDIASNGKVFFNRIINGEPVFLPSSAQTPSPIFFGNNISPQFLAPDTALQSLQERNFPLQDIVRSWKVPFTGTISITGAVQLVNTGSPINLRKDGVRVSIQYNGSVLWFDRMNRDDFNPRNPNLNNIAVTKGQLLLFRLQSVYDGQEDLVNWNPVIDYTTPTVPPTDANNRPTNHYQASEDFVPSNKLGVKMVKDGQVKINGLFSKNITSDTVRLLILKEVNGIQLPILQTPFPGNSVISNQPITLNNLSVATNDHIIFVIACDSYIDRFAVDWKPHYEYTLFTDGTPPTNNGRPVLEGFSAPDNSNYNDWLRAALTLNNIQPDTISIKPLINGTATATGSVLFTVKRANALVGKSVIQLQNGIVIGSVDSVSVIRQSNQILHCSYQTSDRTLALALGITKFITKRDSSYINILGDTIRVVLRDTLQANLYTEPAEDYLGTLYRGWGHFSFKGNANTIDNPLDESKINTNALGNYSSNPLLFVDTSSLNNINDASQVEFIPLHSDIQKHAWVGFDSSVFVNGSQMSSSRLWMHDVKVDSVMSGGSLIAVNKITDTRSNSYSYAPSSFPNSSQSSSTSSTINRLDMQDMNGDRFPDVLSINNIQFTLPSGGLAQNIIQHNQNASVFEGSSSGVSLGGSIPTSFAKNYLSITASNVARNAGTILGISGTGSIGNNNDEVPETWADMNGDGLPDKVFKNGTVSLNLGYSFSTPENWSIADIEKNNSDERTTGASYGYNSVYGSVQYGYNLERSLAIASTSFVDVNGDHLPDKLWLTGNAVLVQLNKGNGFGPIISWNGLNAIRNNSSTGESYSNASTTVSVYRIGLRRYKYCENPSSSSGNGVSRELTQIADIDGDDYADILESSNDGNLIAKRSTIGRTNLLKSVKRPMGSAFAIDYERLGNTYAMPQSKWVLKNVEISDGISGDGIDTMRSNFSYEGGYYDRNEREFYGFSKVQLNQLNTAANNTVYRSTIQKFQNTTLYNKGLLVQEWQQDASGNKYIETKNTYDFRQVRDSVQFPALVKSEKLFYEGATAPGVTTKTEFDYDLLGNPIKINDAGDGSQEDILMATITYHDNNARYIKSIPATIEVSTFGGIIRKRATTINNQGDITQIRHYLTNDSFAVYDLEYNTLGNLSKITRPTNYKGQRMWYAYEYDNQVNTYVTKVTDAFGYISSSTYDVRFGSLTSALSMNNELMRYQLDSRGRLTFITGPYEIAAGKPYTIAFVYRPDAAVPYAITRHYDPEFDADINTITFMDGLGRSIQVKKQAAIFKGKNLPDDIKMIVSGKTVYDAFGRVINSYFPTTEPIAFNNLILSPATAGGIMSTNTYDVLDRNLSSTLADGSTSTIIYGISNGFFSAKATDALNNSKEMLSDVKDRKRIVNVFGGPNGTITTRYKYNAMSELLKVVDAGNNTITYAYDNLGRQLNINHPDAGLTTFKYDLADNLLEKTTAQIKKEIPNGGAIKYLYDYERLSDIDYPRQYQNRVKYTYGKAGSGNKTGRLILQEDASGGQEFYYGKLGEVIKTIRTMLVNKVFYTTYVSEQEYDTWNRIKKMTYPDGEVVKYYYNKGGTLDSMNGYKLGNNYSYVKQLGYDEFEQRVYLQYGNGTEAKYTYDSQRRRLINLKAATDTGRLFMNNSYTYDAVSNVLGITNNIQAQPGTLGGFSKHTYTYDNLYRLTGAIGEYQGQQVAGYNLTMAYDNLYNITGKKQVISAPSQSYDNTYTYTGIKPHQPTQIGGVNYNYDQNGNLLSYGNRRNYWDEENRLMAVIDNGTLSQYTYDADGERAVKSSGGLRGTWVNGAPAGFVSHDTNYTAYVSPYIVCRRTGFTKHYYIENQRISSRIGIGRFSNISFSQPAITAGGIDYIKRLANIERQRYEYYASLGISPGPPTDKFFYGHPYNSGIAAPIIVDSTSNSIPAGWPGNTTPPPTGPPIFISPIPSNDSVHAGYGFVGTGFFYEQNQYFYHPDHLGSSAYVTNVFGEVCQHQEYAAYGELFFEEHNSSNQMPYLFNSKERDAETGLYYYGARYYDPKTSIWTSVDPLLDEESQIEKSPYAYTWNNPIKYTDPDGKIIETAWDAFNVGIGVVSFVDNVKKGNVGWAIVDGLGIIADGAATALPFIPGGAGSVIRAARGIEKTVEVVKDVKKIDKANDFRKVVEETKGLSKTESTAKDLIKNGRAGKQAKLRELVDDPKLGSTDRGWIKQEINQINRGKRTNIRNPPGKDLAHERGREAAKGYSYKHSKLQNREDHKIQHKFDNNGKANKERKID